MYVNNNDINIHIFLIRKTYITLTPLQRQLIKEILY